MRRSFIVNRWAVCDSGTDQRVWLISIPPNGSNVLFFMCRCLELKSPGSDPAERLAGNICCCVEDTEVAGY